MGRRSKKGRQLHGILLLDKATNCSSNHALQRIKRLFDARKAGHTGSLDPLATGMLPICFGEATKISAFLLDADKIYQSNVRLGVRTDSADADGEVIATSPLPADLSQRRIEQVLAQFLGVQQQIPPMYSALKVDGQRLYKLARQGLTVERQARTVRIDAIELLHWQHDLLRIQVSCSKGTYIRTLVEDIGESLGCGAHVETLRRIVVTPFDGEAMVTQEALEAVLADGGLQALDSRLLPLERALPDMPQVNLAQAQAVRFCQGQAVEGQMVSGDTASSTCYFQVYAEQGLLGIGRAQDGSAETWRIRPYRLFNW